MMKKLLGSLISLLFVNGCALIPLPESARNEFDLQQSELARPTGLQFYVSKKIVLREKIATDRNQKIKDHRLVVKDKDYKNELIIKAWAPGKGVKVSDGEITVNFDKKNPAATLRFVPSQKDDASGSYILQQDVTYNAENHSTTKYHYVDDYDGKTYDISWVGNNPRLYVDEKQLYKLKNDKTKIKGSKYSDYSLLRHWFRTPAK